MQAGALNISVWERLVSEKKVDTDEGRASSTPRRPTTTTTGRCTRDLPAAVREKLLNALLSLSPNDAQGKEILELQRATRFVPTKADNYKGIEAAARSAGLL